MTVFHATLVVMACLAGNAGATAGKLVVTARGAKPGAVGVGYRSSAAGPAAPARDATIAPRLRLQVDAFDWPVLILAAVGAEFDVINPPEFRHYLRDVGRLFLRGATATA